VAKAIAVYVPNTLRNPPKGVPEFQRRGFTVPCRQTKKCA